MSIISRRPTPQNHGLAAILVMITVVIITIPVALGVPLMVTGAPPYMMPVPATLALGV
jgi:hypothetical protein